MKLSTSKMTVMKEMNRASVQIRMSYCNFHLNGDRNVQKKIKNLPNNLHDPFLPFKISHRYVFHYKMKFIHFPV